MGGGSLQLTALGPQDIYLTGNPQITFFKSVYKRHTNFSIETIPLTFKDDIDFGNTNRVCIIERNGDLVGPMYLHITLPELKQEQTHKGQTSTYVSWVEGIGNALIKSVELKIGEYSIDKHFGEWLDIWGELNVTSENQVGYDKMVGNRYSSDDMDPEEAVEAHPVTLQIPLRFWFNNHPGLALPINALQYHQVRLIFEFEDLKNLVRSDIDLGDEPKDITNSTAKITDCILLTDYYYLSSDEQRIFSQVAHEYIIEQLQFNSFENLEVNQKNKNIDIDFFKNPVKYLIWVIQDKTYLETESGISTTDTYRKASGNQKLRYSSLGNINGDYNTFKNAILKISNNDRIKEREADYFRLIQNMQFFKKVPRKYIYTYSFCLKPNEPQPSGSANMSKVDFELDLEFDTTTVSENFKSTGGNYTGQTQNELEVKIYAVNYNILKVVGGQAGLVYNV